MADWYRRKTWTKIDEEEFFHKLSRARKDGRAQYLRLQAYELTETKDPKLLEVAKVLLNRILTEYPNEHFEKSAALHLLGHICKQFQDYRGALNFYKQALDFEKIFPNVKTQAYLDFSELIIKTGNLKYFDEVECILLKKNAELLFPIEKYKVNSILSIINKYKGNQEKANYFAELAEQNANAETSGLMYHKHLGIVHERDDLLDKLVKENEKL